MKQKGVTMSGLYFQNGKKRNQKCYTSHGIEPLTYKTKNKVRITPQEQQAPVKGQVRISRVPSSLIECHLF